MLGLKNKTDGGSSSGEGGPIVSAWKDLLSGLEKALARKNLKGTTRHRGRHIPPEAHGVQTPRQGGETVLAKIVALGGRGRRLALGSASPRAEGKHDKRGSHPARRAKSS